MGGHPSDGEAASTSLSLESQLVVSVLTVENKSEKIIFSNVEKAKKSKKKLACLCTSQGLCPRQVRRSN